MKKLMFGLACAAAVCAMADNSVGFEEYIGAKDFVGNHDDMGHDTGDMYFAYRPASGSQDGSSGSQDGSSVKRYGINENLPAFNYGKKRPNAFVGAANDWYLELSTEGGTLWRGFEVTDDFDAAGNRQLGSVVSLTDVEANDANVYVDTLVQFTPTEDGSAPTVDPADQMAIWLNVDSSNPEAPVTNLCILAATVDQSFTGVATTFTVPNKAQDAAAGIDVVPGQWYRLTVKTYADLTDGECIPGFQLYIDGKLVKTDTQCISDGLIQILEGNNEVRVPVDQIKAGSAFASLWTLGLEGSGSPENPTFQGVGFKGSGAIDDLSLTTGLPNIFEDVGTVDFTLTWDTNVSAVSYTIGGDTVTIEDLSTGSVTVAVEPDTVVTVAATAKDWFAVTAGAGDVTIDEEKTIDITTALVETLADAGIKNLEGVAVADAKAWADANKLTPAQIADCAFALDAYLMNAGLDAAPALAIVDIAEVEGGWAITVKATAGEADINLGAINGALKVKTAATLDALDAAAAAEYAITTAEDGTAVVKVTGDNTNFMKATVTTK